MILKNPYDPETPILRTPKPSTPSASGLTAEAAAPAYRPPSACLEALQGHWEKMVL